MRTLCDSCEAAAAQFFCAADEAALCAQCDEKVHSCNKLASRHIRLQLRESWSVPRCDICETAPAFLHCSIDGSSLCLQCDMDVHIGGKRTHQRYLLLGQRVELPNGLNLLEEYGNGKTVDTGRAWQKKYCQEHLHSVAPCHKTNVESNGHLNNGTPCNKKNVEPNGSKD
ncbi:hypothetical protein SUGI_0496910 [Cryptomeria japonica]|uniref:B-box zinc finger protein 18 isoform X1 n=1 Tax=Cryptomeria japonica TaxID=3369 RepID=UPI002408E0D3|nr:B-box zinc finger protein 18 isoform X1 [Cryptomeria japonica]GLJ25922.1 hypothetical protein SUGI_0496910 [Cryptomeria japonica]